MVIAYRPMSLKHLWCFYVGIFVSVCIKGVLSIEETPSALFTRKALKYYDKLPVAMPSYRCDGAFVLMLRNWDLLIPIIIPKYGFVNTLSIKRG